MLYLDQPVQVGLYVQLDTNSPCHQLTYFTSSYDTLQNITRNLVTGEVNLSPSKTLLFSQAPIPVVNLITPRLVVSTERLQRGSLHKHGSKSFLTFSPMTRASALLLSRMADVTDLP